MIQWEFGRFNPILLLIGSRVQMVLAGLLRAVSFAISRLELIGIGGLLMLMVLPLTRVLRF